MPLIRRITSFLRVSPRELTALALVFAASLPAVTARLYSSDEVEYLSYLRSLWFDRDVSFENEYQYFYDHDIAQAEGFHETFLERSTTAGRRVNYATMGCAVLWAPFYGIADLATRAARATGRDVAGDGYSRPYVAAVAYGSAFYGFAAILLSVAAARRIVGPRGAMVSAALVWLGTPLLFYMYVAPPFSHACSAFGVALFVTLWLHVRESWSVRGTILLGLSAALMAMVREQDVFFAIGPAFDWAIAAAQGAGLTAQGSGLTAQGSGLTAQGSGLRAQGRGRAQGSGVWGKLVAAGAGCLAFVAGFSPQLLAYNALNGYPLPAADVTRKMTWYAPHGLQVLASPAHGFFVWTPLAILAIAGLVLLALRRDSQARRVGWSALLMIASQAYIAGSVESWTVAGAFGQRRFVAVTILLVIGLSALWSALRDTPRRVVAVAAAVCVWWNLALMAQFALRLMDRQRVEPARNAYHAFVTLPRMLPTLAYRYLFDRSSFYEGRGTRP